MSVAVRETQGDQTSALRACLQRVDAELTRLLDGIGALDGRDGGLRADQVAALEAEATRLRNRADAARLRLGAVAGELREAGRSSHLSEAQFLGSGGRMDGATAAREGALAGALGNGVPVTRGPVGIDPPGGRSRGERTATGRALDDGRITTQHASAVHRTLEELPGWVDDRQRQEVERHLLRLAERLRPGQLRAAGRRALEALEVPAGVVDEHENELVRSREEAALEASFFAISHRPDGTSTGRFTVPTLQGRLLEKVLSSMTSPTRRGAGRARPGAGQTQPGASQTQPGAGQLGHQVGAAEAAQDRAVERGRALADLIDHLPTDRLGGRTAYTVIVSTDLDTLRGETDRAGLTDTGEVVSAQEVRRLAAEAGIVPTVMGGESLPLDLGTQRRFFTESQRLALAHLYSECAVEDCDRPFAWTQMHHENAWAARRPWLEPPAGAPPGGAPPGGAPRAEDSVEQYRRGRTNLSNAIPLCGRHNRLIEQPGVVHTVERDTRGRATVRFELAVGGTPVGGPPCASS